MGRTLGAKNKPKELKSYETLPDILTTAEASKWLRMAKSTLLKHIYNGSIPKDCYFTVGCQYRLIKNRLAIWMGIKESQYVGEAAATKEVS